MPDLTAPEVTRVGGRLQESGRCRFRALTFERAEPVAEDGRLRLSFSSEAPVERYDWWTGERYYEVLSHAAGEIDLSYARDGLPFCKDHDLGVQVGLLENVALGANGRMYGDLRQGNHPDAGWLVQDMKDGIRTKVSVGYDPGETYDEIRAKEKGGIPTRIYRNWLPIEVSSVPVPADYEVGPGRARELATPGSVAPAADRETATSEAPVAEENAMADNATAAPTGAERDAQDKAAELDRRDRLTAIAERYERMTDLPAWVRGNKSVDEVKDMLLEEQREKVGGITPVIRSGDGAVTRGGELKPFETMGEFLREVANAANPSRRVDPRLQSRAGSGHSESIGADGGFAVPAGFIQQVLEPVYETGAILSRVNRIPISQGSGVKYPVVDETSRVNGSRFGGVSSAWVAEGDTLTASKIKLRMQELDLKKLSAAFYATDELLEDATALEALAGRAFSTELEFRGEDAVINGTGQGMPLGLLAAACTASQAIEGTQSIANSNQFIATNIAKMRSRFMGRWSNAVWFYNQELLPTLMLAKLDASSGAVPLFIPAGGLAGATFDRIMGAPAIPVDYCAAVGTPGDLILADLSQYDWIDKGGPKMASSAHVKFLSDEMTFRLTWRVDGQPQLRTAITPYKGALSRSPFVTLAVRS